MSFQTYIKSPERIEVGPAYGAVSDLAKTEWMHGYTLRGIWRCQNGSVTISLEALHLDERVKLNLHVGDRVVYIDGEPAVMNRSELAGYEPENPAPPPHGHIIAFGDHPGSPAAIADGEGGMIAIMTADLLPDFLAQACREQEHGC